MRLLLIRHGESHHSARQLLAGQNSCPGLTERGLRQAQILADRMRSSGELQECRLLLSSPVLRASQTAGILAETLLLKPVKQDCDLCELHLGQADGLTWQDYATRFGAFDLISEPSRPIAPAGESWDGFLRRVQQTLDRLAARYTGKTVVAVTHAGFIVAAIVRIFAIPRPGSGAQLDPSYTSITELERADTTWKLLRYNDTAHLRAPLSAGPQHTSKPE